MRASWNVWEGVSHFMSCSSAEGETCCAEMGESEASLYTVWAVNMDLMNKSVLVAVIQN